MGKAGPEPLSSTSRPYQCLSMSRPHPVPAPDSAASPAPSCRVRCQCGGVQGSFTRSGRAIRLLCYCHDCQGFAHQLGQAKRVLDRRGGLDVLLTLPKNLTFTQGADQLACLRLTPGGLLRWHTRCCSTLIGSTLASPKLSFMGLSNTCLDLSAQSLDDVLGPVTAWSFTRGARGSPRPTESGRGRLQAFALLSILRARLNGDYRHTPFFRPDTGAPVATPRVLTSEEHTRLMTTVRQA